jgi:hypothetical protein
LEIFSIALNGNLEKVAEDEPIEDWVLENFSQPILPGTVRWPHPRENECNRSVLCYIHKNAESLIGVRISAFLCRRLRIVRLWMLHNQVISGLWHVLEYWGLCSNGTEKCNKNVNIWSIHIYDGPFPLIRIYFICLLSI